MTMTRLLTGITEPSYGDDVHALKLRIAKLEVEVSDLERQIRNKDSWISKQQEETTRLKGELERYQDGVARLRQFLVKPYHALAAIFGELDVWRDTIGEVQSDAYVSSAGKDPDLNEFNVGNVWKAWKQKLPGKPSELIQALLDHGPMTREQVRIALHCSWSSVDNAFKGLKQAGLLIEPSSRGGKYSLKAL